jgi:sigma-E factor negative regulatory protein RseA
MTDQIREQVSALLDGELSRDEVGLLVRRMERDAELRGRFGRYSTIGETLRAPGGPLASPGFAARVSAAIDAPGEPASTVRQALAEAPLWRRPAFAAGMAAALALVAVIAVRPFAGIESVPARGPGARSAGELIGTASPTPAQSQRLAGYMVAHSQFSSPIGRHAVWSGLLAADPGLSRVSYETIEAP